jgi:aspartate dehydrogenase
MTTAHVGHLRVGLLGYGAIGRPVAQALRAGAIPDAELVAVSTSSGAGCPEATDVAGLITRSDLVVEAAGHQAARSYASQVLEAGVDLVLVSVGVMADEKLRHALCASGPGRLIITSGAIGGLDLLRSVRRAGPVSVQLVSTKRPTSLVQPWMDPEQAEALRDAIPGDAPMVVFDGSASEAARRFPANAKVAATLALAVGEWDAVRVRLIADPAASTTHHDVSVTAATGCYRLSIRNVPSPDNPATSQLVVDAVIRVVADWTADKGPHFL